MNNATLLKRIYDLAHQGIYIPLTNLPNGISKEVVEKNLLYIELRNLMKSGKNPARIEEIKSILITQDSEEGE